MRVNVFAWACVTSSPSRYHKQWTDHVGEQSKKIKAFQDLTLSSHLIKSNDTFAMALKQQWTMSLQAID